MRVRVYDPEDAADLAEFLSQRAGAIVEKTGGRELEVSLLGSYADAAMRDELETALRRWELVRQRPGGAELR
jgi:hypothetical protein